MNVFVLFGGYFKWHYGRGFVDIMRVWRNFLWFTLHFFSVPLLIRTLFSPWQRLHEEYKKGFDLKSFFSTLLVNTLMRIVGSIIRLLFIIIGIILFFAVAIAGLLFLAFWVVAPFGIVVIFLAGLMLISI
jgi:hypothetical protein